MPARASAPYRTGVLLVEAPSWIEHLFVMARAAPIETVALRQFQPTLATISHPPPPRQLGSSCATARGRGARGERGAGRRGRPDVTERA